LVARFNSKNDSKEMTLSMIQKLASSNFSTD